ncbi:MAG: NADH-quinone oxidoreductase subunit M [Actinomycetes bacterium]
MTQTWLLPVIVGLPLVASVLLLLAGRRADRWALPFGVGVTGVVLLLSLVLLGRFDTSASSQVQFDFSVSWVPQLDLSIHLGIDGLSLPMVVLTSLLCFLCALYSLRNLPEPGRPRAFVGLFLLLQVGLLGAFAALDLVLFFVFFEIVLAPMWFLIDGWGSGEKRRSANVFILYTLLGSVVMLLGFLLVWSSTGTTDMVVLADQHGSQMSGAVQLAAALLIGIGLAVKTPVWPLHSWLPDAHTAAPTAGSVLLAGVMLKMGTYGLVRIVLPQLPEGARALAPYLAALGVVGIVYGAMASYAQRDLKRLIAFSSVGHMGFVALGIATLTGVGVNGAMFGNVAHGLITGLLFFVAGSIKVRYGTLDLRSMPRSLYARAPRLGFVLGFAAVASLGLPGLAGFWGEFLPMLGAYHPAVPARALYRVLLVIAALGTVFAAAYFLRVLRRVAQGPSTTERVRDLTGLEAASWLPLVVLIVVLGLLPSALLDLTGPTVESILDGVPGVAVVGTP